MAPVERIQRLLHLVELLQSGRVFNSVQLADNCRVSRRTVFRDIETLRESGVAVSVDEERQGYTMSGGPMLPAANFTVQETLSLLVLCHELGDERTGIPFQGAVQSAALKLLSNLPGHFRENVVAKVQALSVRLGAHSDPHAAAPFFETLLRGIVERKQVRIRYRSLFEWTEITTALSPYRILYSRRSWYVIGRSTIHSAVRTFNVGRIQGAELISSPFTVPRRFSLDRYLGNAWHLIRGKPRHNVVVRFQKQVATNVAEILWHKTQKVRVNRDGTLDFHASVDGLGEIIWWILGYGDQAEVLKPRQLRNMVAAHVAALAQIYGIRPPIKMRTRPDKNNGRSLRARSR